MGEAARKNVYDFLEAAFELATTLGWTREEFMLAAQDVFKAEQIPKTEDG
jgi:hypothetical protein